MEDEAAFLCKPPISDVAVPQWLKSEARGKGRINVQGQYGKLRMLTAISRRPHRNSTASRRQQQRSSLRLPCTKAGSQVDRERL